MLYNPEWSKPEVKDDPFKLETLIAWLEKQPTRLKYEYVSIDACLMAQYLKARGFKGAVVSGGDAFAFGNPKNYQFGSLPRGWSDLAFHEPRTFGAALKRARALHRADD